MEVIDGREGKQLEVTSIADLKSYANGSVVRFSDFAEGQPFVARVRRPSLLALAKIGKIPNELLKTASDLFTKGVSASPNGDNSKLLIDVYDVCRIVCDAALVEPTLKQIEEAGLELSDKHLIEIFNYSQIGVKALEQFRQ